MHSAKSAGVTHLSSRYMSHESVTTSIKVPYHFYHGVNYIELSLPFHSV